MIELGLLDQHLAHLKTIYPQRLATLSTALRQHLPDSVTFTEPSGGFFFWVELPEEFDTQQLLAEARAHHGVGFQTGIKFSSQQALRNGMRLSFSFYEADKLQEGVRRLKEVIVPS